MTSIKRQFSAGGIVFNKQGKVLLINNAAMRDPSKSYWGFPKGHLEPGETSRQAAVREVKEETGIEAEIIGNAGESKYVFTQDGEKIFKAITVFAMKKVSGELKFQSEELLAAEWITPDQALSKLSFSQDKGLLKKALEVYG